jgi:hypothetical protein
MFDILSLIPGKKRLTPSGWHSFNAVCCGYRGHKPDRRGRGGLRTDGVNWTMHCFNCGFSCGFTLGKSIPDKTRTFLRWLGIDQEEIQKWNLESLKNRDALELIAERKRTEITFKTKKLPDSVLLDKNNPEHDKYYQYLLGRKVDIDRYQFYVNPESTERQKDGIIIPYMYRGKIVGSTTRFLDGKTPKYINDQQQGYVFNLDKQKPDWQVCIASEGIFDAISIDGVALMHDDISDDQASLLYKLNRTIIVVPHQDHTGLKITDRALELGFQVSLPEWGLGIKDINEAVCAYGKFPVLLSILHAATTNRVKIELRKKQIAKRV